jgi:hypothetical protein
MKRTAYLLIALGLFLFAYAANDEHRGIASVTPSAFNGVTHTAYKVDDPKQFGNLMFYEWLRAFLWSGAGIILLRMCRRANKLDPLSPDFQGNPELDELGKELDQEREKRQRPLR